MTDEQMRMLPGLEPEDVMAQAYEEHGPFVARVCLFSGGNDSAVTAHVAREHYDELAWLDTTTAVPGVREFVVEFAEWLGKPLRILEHGGDAYRSMVLGVGEDPRTLCPRCDGTGSTRLLDTDDPVAGEGPKRPCPRCAGVGKILLPLGFPGPAQHGRAYNRLKERLTEELHRELKGDAPRMARVLYVTGVRRAESARRATRQPVNRKGGRVYANPLIDWTTSRLHAYRREHGIPQSDVAALLHRSGECNCGAFAQPGEREMLQSLFPKWWNERIAPLEAEAEALGLPFCKWGNRPEPARAGATQEGPSLFDDAGELCSTCAWRGEGT